MNIDALLQRALAFEFLSAEEGQYLFEHAPTADLMYVANELRKIQKPDGLVTWQIDRNVNTTNACIANCKSLSIDDGRLYLCAAIMQLRRTLTPLQFHDQSPEWRGEGDHASRARGYRPGLPAAEVKTQNRKIGCDKHF